MEKGIMMEKWFCSILFHPEDMLRAMLFGVSSRTVLVASWGAWLDGWAWWVSLRQDQVLMHEIYWNMGSPVLSSCIMYTGIHNHISHVSHVSHKESWRSWILTSKRFNDFSVFAKICSPQIGQSFPKLRGKAHLATAQGPTVSEVKY